MSLAKLEALYTARVDLNGDRPSSWSSMRREDVRRIEVDDRGVWIVFTDGTWAFVYRGPWHSDGGGPSPWYGDTKKWVSLGLISQSDADEATREGEAKAEAEYREHRREQYQKLREEFEPKP